MAKGKDAKKKEKKEPAKTKKQKKEEKRLKKSKQDYLFVGKQNTEFHPWNVVLNLNM